jgi:hypothetical protein
MNSELQNKLYEKYPQLFVNKDKTPMQSPMSFGIECGEGWYDILSSLCWMIKQHEENIAERVKIRNKFGTQNDGEDLDYSPVHFDQIKEKYGGLRVYFSGGDKYIEGLVSMAEAMSYKICDVCGNKGEANKKGWISTHCEAHRNS